eukprot:TRINITY_DN16793_c0_g2_i1.p1 TRINITY_DN16793_c0_g2~~TRINITY_DN16793_c0_g2_i1.p1  ORF type:complete len:490 (+),score=120.36 TRINITY_DN16793_c0_g2_i1:63-1472(+)
MPADDSGIGSGVNREKALARAAKVRDQGHTRASMGKYGEAEALYLKCLSLRVEVVGTDHPIVAAINTDIGDMWMSQHEFAKTEPYYEAATRIVTSCIDKEPDSEQLQSQHRRVLRDMGFLCYLQGSVEQRKAVQTAKWQKAEVFFRDAIERTEAQLGRKTTELVEPLRNLASLYVKMGNFQKGELNFRRCIGIQLHNFGMDDQRVLQTRQQLAIVHERRDQRIRYDAASKLQALWRGYRGRCKARAVRQRRTAKKPVSPPSNDGGSDNGALATPADGEAESAEEATPPPQQGYFASGCAEFGDYQPRIQVTLPGPGQAQKPEAEQPAAETVTTPAEQTALVPLEPPTVIAGGYGARRRERDRLLQLIAEDAAAATASPPSTGSTPTQYVQEASVSAADKAPPTDSAADVARKRLTGKPFGGSSRTAGGSRVRQWAIRSNDDAGDGTAELTAEENELLGYLPGKKGPTQP